MGTPEPIEANQSSFMDLLVLSGHNQPEQQCSEVSFHRYVLITKTRFFFTSFFLLVTELKQQDEYRSQAIIITVHGAAGCRPDVPKPHPSSPCTPDNLLKTMKPALRNWLCR